MSSRKANLDAAEMRDRQRYARKWREREARRDFPSRVAAQNRCRRDSADGDAWMADPLCGENSPLRPHSCIAARCSYAFLSAQEFLSLAMKAEAKIPIGRSMR